MLANLTFGAVLAGLSLGPTGWADLSAFEGRVSSAVMVVIGAEDAASPLNHAAARARAALPELPNGSH